MTLSPRDRLIVTIAACVLGLLLLAGVLIYPQVQKLSSLNSQVAAAEAEVQAAKMRLAERQGFRDRAIENSAKWLRLMNEVPDSPDLASLIIELQDAAYKSGVQLVVVTPATPAEPAAGETPPPYKSIPVSIEIVGSWADTIDYMEGLMHLDRGVRIVNTSTVRTTNQTSANRTNSSLPRYAVDTLMSLMTYTIPSNAASGTPDAAVPAQ